MRRLALRLGRLLAGARTVGRLLASATVTGLHDVTRITICDVLYVSQPAALRLCDLLVCIQTLAQIWSKKQGAGLGRLLGQTRSAVC